MARAGGRGAAAPRAAAQTARVILSIGAEAVVWYEGVLKASPAQEQSEIAEHLKRARLFKTPGAKPRR